MRRRASGLYSAAQGARLGSTPSPPNIQRSAYPTLLAGEGVQAAQVSLAGQRAAMRGASDGGLAEFASAGGGEKRRGHWKDRMSRRRRGRAAPSQR